MMSGRDVGGDVPSEMTAILREAAGRCRRKADISVGWRERRDWAESGPTGVTSGTTGVRAGATIPLQARNTLHRPERTLVKAPQSITEMI